MARPPRPRHLNSVPPSSMLPMVAKLIDERAALVAERGKASAESARLRHRGVESDARKADAALLADAARDGKQISKVGTPNLDKLHADLADVDTKLAGLSGAIDNVERELGDAIVAKVDAIDPHVQAEVDEASKRYSESVDAANTARRDMYRWVEVRKFVDMLTGVERSTGTQRPASLLPGRAGLNAADVFGALALDALQGGVVPDRRTTKVSGAPFGGPDSYTPRQHPLD